MDAHVAIRAAKSKLSDLYGDRLVSVVLFGSYARGDATTKSDIDLMVVLRGDVQAGLEIDRMVDPLYDIILEHGIFIQIVPISEDDYAHRKSPLLLNVRREGVVT